MNVSEAQSVTLRTEIGSDTNVCIRRENERQHRRYLLYVQIFLKKQVLTSKSISVCKMFIWLVSVTPAPP